MKALKITGIVIAGLLAIMLLIGGYFGVVPWVSRLFGSNQARDLGVELTVENAYAGAEILGVPATPAELESLTLDPEAAKRFDATMSSDQASSMLLIGQSGIPSWPLQLVQIRFNEDGTAEASGYLNASQAVPFMLSAGVSQDNADKVASALKLSGSMPFYVKGTCGVANNAVDLSLSEVEIGRVGVPASWYQGNEPQGTPYITNLLNTHGFQVESLTIADGAVSMKGTRPLSSYAPWLSLVGNDVQEAN